MVDEEVKTCKNLAKCHANIDIGEINVTPIG